MNKNFTAFILFLFFFGAIPVSCDILCRDSCGCGKIEKANDFMVKEFQVVNFIRGQVYNPEVYYKKDEFYKVLDIKEFEFISQSIPNQGMGFIQGAFACDPGPHMSAESIIDILIINKREWISFEGEIFPIGSDISSHFTISDYPHLSGESISDYLASGKRMFLGEGLFLKFESALIEDSDLMFDVEIKLSNGNNYYFQNEKMKIQNL
ncbi:hypothetical protein M3O96_20115 [Aquiflexum sp. TKW24L]|uniref:hypothetical protein n=1 Tax=Aquiflexum sp. TKW24L TaxID=2942212 RepID=UPI0020BFBA76|nr:hypothetical protein [Aquiflexum sp. TKW24L]MCL6261416.1 hypothetical protein [Aquiflexum sp. TKW24L]